MTVLGTLHAADGKGVVRVTDRFDAGIDEVWAALTEPSRLACWLGEFEGELRVDGEFRAYFLACGWRGEGRVVTCDPPRRLFVETRAADDRDSGYDHAIEIGLATERDVTVLVWEERGMCLDLLSTYGAGIQLHVEDLGSYLAGGDRCDASARFDELHPAYEGVAAYVS